MEASQFVARLKRRSEHAHQTAPGVWFAVEFRYRYDDYFVCGNQNVYRLRDVDLGVMLPNGTVRRL